MNDAQDAVPETPSLIRRRRPFLAPIWLLGFGAIAVLAVAGVAWWQHDQAHRRDTAVRQSTAAATAAAQAPHRFVALR